MKMKTVILTVIAGLAMNFAVAQTNFCKGWEDGYQDALTDCRRAAVTPVCPIEPLGSRGYKTGYIMGYDKARFKYCN